MQGVQVRSLVRKLRFHLIHGQKEKKNSVSRYSTASGRLRNNRKEGMKDEGGIGHREEMKKGDGSKGLWGRWQGMR